MRAGYGVLTEKRVYEQCVKLLEAAGCFVYRLTQARASRQSPGLPDLWVFGPLLNSGAARCAWVEIKRPGGRLRIEQQVFRERCLRTGVEHVVGGFEEVKQLLVRWGKVAA